MQKSSGSYMFKPKLFMTLYTIFFQMFPASLVPLGQDYDKPITFELLRL